MPLEDLNHLNFRAKTHKIRGSRKKVTELQLCLFSFQLQPNCNYDNVEIYDGANVNARKIGRFCGWKSWHEFRPPGEIPSSGNKLLVKFKTDGRAVAKGFFATFNSIELPAVPEGKPFCLSIRIFGLSLDMTSTFSQLTFFS